MNWTILAGLAFAALVVWSLRRVSLVPATKARDLLQQGAMVVDVRSPGEFHSGHVPEALNIPLGELGDQLPRRIPDKDCALLLHCLSGARSGIARRQLRRLGYHQAFNLGSYGRAQSIVRQARNR